jgi:hypothetical protein
MHATLVADNLEEEYRMDTLEMFGFIDPPSPFASRKVWQEFLKELLTLPEEARETQQVRTEIEAALRHLSKQFVPK